MMAMITKIVKIKITVIVKVMMTFMTIKIVIVKIIIMVAMMIMVTVLYGKGDNYDDDDNGGGVDGDDTMTRITIKMMMLMIVSIFHNDADDDFYLWHGDRTLGPGVYVSRDPNKAAGYGEVTFRLLVYAGKTTKVGGGGSGWQGTHSSAWLPASA